MARYEKCDQCVGQHNKTRLTKQIYDDGGAYCHRCGFVWKNTNVRDLLEALQEEFERDEDDISPLYNWRTVRRTPADTGERSTVLPVYSSVRSGFVSVKMRTQNGAVVGYHNRHLNSKAFFNEGDRALGYVGETLKSTPSTPLILVEGFYDVISERHVCCFGTISKSTLTRYFRLSHLWLFPDPDCVDSLTKRQNLEKMIRDCVRDEMVFIQGYIIGNGDPDEATELVHVPVSAF